jgi:hypothetical protein
MPRKDTSRRTDKTDLTSDDSPTHAPESGEPLETGPKSVRASRADESQSKSRPIRTEAPRARRAEDRNYPPN